MILPGKLNLKGRIGTTFDAIFLVYPSEYSAFDWGRPGEDISWKATGEYEIQQVAVGTDGKAYVALIASTNVNPVGDVSGHWQKLTPFNLSGCTAEMKISGETIVLKVGEGITLGGAAGTVSINATPVQTNLIPGPAKTGYSILITEAGGNLYEYCVGLIVWKRQQEP